jgi:hypothetical protein
LEDSASLDQTKGANEEDFHQVMAKIKLWEDAGTYIRSPATSALHEKNMVILVFPRAVQTRLQN